MKVRIRHAVPAVSGSPVHVSGSRLHTYCRRCRSEVPASACDPTGLCVICIIDDAVAVDKAEYKRLWAKRLRYLRNPHIRSLDHLHEQLARVAKRLGDKVHARIANPNQAIAILNAHLEQARTEVERGEARPRILLPKTGDLLARNNLAGTARGLLSA